MAQIIAKGATTPTTIDDSVVLEAIANHANLHPQDNVVEINGTDYQLDTLVMSGGNIGIPTLLGTITGAELNALPANPSVSKTFVGAKPNGKSYSIGLGAWIKTTTAFNSGTAQIDVVSLDSTYTQAPSNTAGTYGILGSNKALRSTPEDLTVTFTFAGGVNNPQDFNADALMGIYAVLMDIPTL